MDESKGACGGGVGVGMTIPTLPVRWLYRLASTHAFTERGLYLNLGYWPGARTIDEACEAMVELVGRTAGISSTDEVVDVGFGFAEQDIFWTRRFAPRRIIGLNITPEQVRLARARVRTRPGSSRRAPGARPGAAGGPPRRKSARGYRNGRRTRPR